MELKQLAQEIERASEHYAKKFNIERDGTWLILKLQEEVGELTQSYLMLIGQARPKGKSAKEIEAEFHKEVADVFGQVLLLANFYSIDLEKEMHKKWFRKEGKST